MVVISTVVIRSVIKPLWLLLGDKVPIGFEMANHVIAASCRTILIAISPKKQRVLGSLCFWIIKALEVRALNKAKIFAIKCATVEHGCALVLPLFSVTTRVDTNLIALSQVHHQLLGRFIVPDMWIAEVLFLRLRLHDWLAVIIRVVGAAIIERICDILVLTSLSIARKVGNYCRFG